MTKFSFFRRDQERQTKSAVAVEGTLSESFSDQDVEGVSSAISNSQANQDVVDRKRACGQSAHIKQAPSDQDLVQVQDTLAASLPSLDVVRENTPLSRSCSDLGLGVVRASDSSSKKKKNSGPFRSLFLLFGVHRGRNWLWDISCVLETMGSRAMSISSHMFNVCQRIFSDAALFSSGLFKSMAFVTMPSVGIS